MSAEVITFWLFALAIGVAACWHLIRQPNAWAALGRWASRKGFREIRRRRHWLAEDNRFPFTPVSGAQQVFQIHVQDETGVEKTGWILLGSLWMGCASTQVQIVWE